MINGLGSASAARGPASVQDPGLNGSSPARPTFFVHSAAARLAPGGAALVHTMRYLEPNEKIDRHRPVAELEAVMDLVQPGWRACERAPVPADHAAPSIWSGL